MKTIKLTLAGIMLLTLAITSVKAQTRGNGNVTTQERQVSDFNAINVGCAIHLYVSQGDQQSVKVKTDENIQNKIITKVNNGMLHLSCDNIKDATKMDIYVTAVNLSKIDASGASKVTGETLLKSEDFGLYISGAAKANLDIETGTFNNETSGAASTTLNLKANTANTEISGAGNMKLKGTAEKHITEVSGAGNLKALEFVTNNTDADISGAGNASVMARHQIKADLSGAGNLSYFEKDNIKKISKQGEYQFTFDGMDNVKSLIIEEDKDADRDTDDYESVDINHGGAWNVYENDDSVTVIINDKRIVVVTDDSVRVNIGQHDVVVTDDGVKFEKHNKRPKFNGHWAGFGLSVNGLLNQDHMIDYPEGAPYLDINYNKSTGVNVNFFEQSVNLYNNHLGLVTGLGVTWNNYRFADNVILTDTSGHLDGYFDETPGFNYQKSKLMLASLRIPLLLEYQTNSYMKTNSFHVSAGAVGSVRMWSHTKNEINDSKSKNKGDFYVNPFIVQGMATIGWGIINLYGTYSFSEMFRNEKGPTAYPFEVGITLIGF
jgi:hypothetical protein